MAGQKCKYAQQHLNEKHGKESSRTLLSLSA